MPRDILLRIWWYWTHRLDDRAGIVDFNSSLLDLKKEDLLQEVKNRKYEKKYTAPASQAREVYGKAHCHQRK